MVFLGIFVSIIIFSLLILIHEYGHYKCARMFGIHVEEFGLGIPPRAKKLWKNKDGTLFSLNWIPLWGFVKIAGESEMVLEIFTKSWRRISENELGKFIAGGTELFDKKWITLKKSEKKYLAAFLERQKPWQNFFEKNIFQKSLVLLAGVIMNLVAAYVIFFFIFFFWAQPIWVNTIIPIESKSYILPSYEEAIEQWILTLKSGAVLYPIPESISAKSWLMDWDTVISADGIEIKNIDSISNYIQSSLGKEIIFEIERNWVRKNISIIPSNEWKIGSYLAPNIEQNKDFIYNFTFPWSLRAAWSEIFAQLEIGMKWIAMILWKLLFPEDPDERSEVIKYVAGPIGIIQVVTLSLSSWFMIITILAGVISVNLALFNLLPIPALDGGRLLLLWVRTWLERVLGKNPKLIWIENMLHILFFITLIALSVLIAYNDIKRIIWS